MVETLKLGLVFFLVACTCNRMALAESAAAAETEQLRLQVPPRLPTTVKIGVKLIRVSSIEPASSDIPKLSAEFKMRIEWLDERLAVKSSVRHEAMAFQDNEATEKLSTIFDPQIKIIDGTSETVHQHLHIFPNGIVNISQVVNVTVEANMDLLHFPFDSQTFYFRFASAYWDEAELDLSLNKLESGLSEDAAPLSWHFDFHSFHITQSHVAEHTETFSVFNFLIHAQRDPRYFLWRLIIPLLVIVILSWNVFWMYEDSVSAFGNCIVFLLTVVAYHQIANGMLPLIPSFTFVDAIVFISYGFIIIPTFQVMITSKLEAQGKTEQALVIRAYCRWLVPIVFILTMLLTTLIYFSRG